MPIRAAELVAEVRADTEKAERDLKGYSDRVDKGVGGAFGVAKTAAIAAGTAAAVAFAGKALTGASDLAEQVSKVGVIFGQASGIVTGFANKMAADFGLPKTVMLEAAGNIGLVGKASGLTQEQAAGLGTSFAGLAADASSFFNVPLEEALTSIRAGLVGEAEPMRRFGVLLNEAAVAEEAMALGLVKTKGELTDQAKVQARASLIMKGMSDAQGDLSRTSESFANRLREMKGRAENFAASVGTFLIPIALKLFDALEAGGKIVKGFVDGIGNQAGKLVDFFQGAGDGSDAWLQKAGPLGRAAAELGTAFRSNFEYSPIERFMAGFSGDMQMFEDMKPGDVFAQRFGDAVGRIMLQGKRLASDLINAGKEALAGIVQELVLFVRNVVKTFQDMPIKTMFDTVKASVEPVLTAVGNLVESFGGIGNILKIVGVIVLAFVAPWALVVAALVLAWNKFEGFRNAVAAIVEFFVVNVVPKIMEFVTHIINGFAGLVEWVKEKWPQIKDTIAAVIEGVWNIIKFVIGVIMKLWKLWGDDLMNIVKGAWDFIMKIVKAAIDFVLGVFNIFAGIFTGDWDRFWNGIKQVFGAVWDAIKAALELVWTTIKGILGAAFSWVREKWDELWDKVKTAVSNAWDRIKEGVSKGAEAVITYFKELPGNFLKGLGNIGNLLYDKGKDVMEGLWNGLNSMKKWVTDKIMALVKAILPDPVEKILGITSPSKVFREIGRNTSKGLAIGFREGLKDVRSAVAQVGQLSAGFGPISMNAAASALAAAPPPTSMSYQNTFNIGETDPFAVAQEVAWKLSVGPQ